MTGGGPAPVQPHDPVMEFLDETNANVDIEIDCPFDSTAVFEKECKYYIYAIFISFLYCNNHFCFVIVQIMYRGNVHPQIRE